MRYLNEKRSKFYHLNHYTIHQITYLCKNLAKTNENGEFPDQVHCLLSSVLKGVSHENIVENLDEATRITDNDDSVTVEENKRKTLISVLSRIIVIKL